MVIEKIDGGLRGQLLEECEVVPRAGARAQLCLPRLDAMQHVIDVSDDGDGVIVDEVQEIHGLRRRIGRKTTAEIRDGTRAGPRRLQSIP